MKVAAHHVAAAVLYCQIDMCLISSELALLVEQVGLSGLGKAPRNDGGNIDATLKKQLRYDGKRTWFDVRSYRESGYADVELVSPRVAVADPKVQYVLRHPQFRNVIEDPNSNFQLSDERFAEFTS